MFSAFSPETEAQRSSRELLQTYGDDWPNPNSTLFDDAPRDTVFARGPFGGVKNLGNTCYLAPLLPIFRTCSPLLLTLEASASPIARALADHVISSATNDVYPGPLLDALAAAHPTAQYTKETQKDAAEALRHVLQGIEEHLRDPSSTTPPLLGVPYEWAIERRAVCVASGCLHQVTPSVDRVSLLPLPIGDKPVHISVLINAATDFKEPEEVTCRHCGHTTAAVRRYAKTPFPQVLCLEVERYRPDPAVKNKIFRKDTEVVLQDPLTLRDHKYSLQVVVVHRGATPRRGHYHTYYKHKGQWYLQDDNKVAEKIRPEDVQDQGKDIYILVYTRDP